ncbi:insulin-like growth factor-binding protein complex acid labile subunit [Bacillus rossius redtenbacheri]|uniref:insulin-like growth factor-binding protein complex acid labile subunit n=1 Tax=Bacillus rossius redtenbacheri TaxID=93214 RepID=UPI002FDD1264
MALAVALTCAVLAEVVLAQDPTCGHCRCHVVHEDLLTGTPGAGAYLHVNCSDDKYFPGQLRPPKLTADDANLPVSAEFMRNSYTYVGDDFLLKGAIRLSLADNDISNVSRRSFSSLTSLQYLSLAQNRLDNIDAEVFHGLGHLEELDLSQNFLSYIPDGLFSELVSLTTLRIASNRLDSIGPKFFQGLSKLQTVDLSFNHINELIPEAFSSLSLLTNLILSGNIITDARADHFAELKNLEYLDLSKNLMLNLEPETLKNQESLKKLILSGNRLTSKFTLPGTIMYLDLSDNPIEDIQDMWKHLDLMEVLLVANTSIDKLDGDFGFKNLQVLNMSENRLESFPVDTLPALQTLDLSWNNLTSVPDGVAPARMPALCELHLDGNPVRELVFPASDRAFEHLRLLSLNGDPQLQAVGPGVLARAAPGLTALRLSRNPLLASLHEQALAGLDLQELDLSWDALSSLPESLVQWERLRSLRALVPCSQLDLSWDALSSLPESLVQWERLRSVNLQHNPWACDCSLQWMLDVVVSRLYTTDQNLLYELRCASPAQLRDRRMVHFYNWTQKVFCTQFEQLRMRPLDAGEDVEAAGLGSSVTAVIVALSLLAALVALVVVGVILQRRISSRRRLRNRRF